MYRSLTPWSQDAKTPVKIARGWQPQLKAFGGLGFRDYYNMLPNRKIGPTLYWGLKPKT